MEIEKKITDGTTTLTLKGWLDVESSPQLADAVNELEKTKNLVFDFEQIEYISSSGVRELVNAYRIQKENEGTFSVINVCPEVMDVLSLTGIDKKLNITAK